MCYSEHIIANDCGKNIYYSNQTFILNRNSIFSQKKLLTTVFFSYFYNN
jgi:hypothetical protein